MIEPVRDLDDLSAELEAIKGISHKIRGLNVTNKTSGGKHYPLRIGYSTKTRRPVSDILRWMNDVEDLLAGIMEIMRE